MPTFKFLYCFGLALCLSCSLLYAQSAEQIIQKSLDARGGEAAFKALKALRIEADVESAQLPMSLSGTTFRARGNKMYNEVSIMGMKVLQAYDGKVAWTKDPMTGSVQKLDPESQKMIATQAYFDDLLIAYKARGLQIVESKTTNIQGKHCYLLVFENKTDKIEYFIDSKTNLPYMQRQRIDKDTEVEISYREFNNVKHIKMPFVIEMKVNGSTLSKVTCKKIELNPNINEDIFAYPNK
ncbi:MAG: hypothetical protein JJT94_15040 [Bernardetiaceae bacterium]|nr:hypothetical protein [Bernardetiaceae bacterium]